MNCQNNYLNYKLFLLSL